MRIGGGRSGSSSSAAAAAAAQRRIEEARRKAEEARRKAAEAQRKAAEAQRQAQAARAEANRARSTLQTRERNFEQTALRQPPAQRARATEELRTLRSNVERLESAARPLETNAAQLRAEALRTADEALRAQRVANTEAKAVGQPEPYRAANEVRDVFDAGSLSANDQVRLFGAQTVVAPEEAGRADAQRVAAATRASPENGARMLEQQLEANPDPAYREALVRASAPSVEELGRQLSLDDGRPSEEAMQATLASLARSAELAGPEGGEALAQSFARHIPDGELEVDDGDRLGGALKEVFKQGTGTTFGVQLATALEGTGKGRAAEDILKAQSQALQDVREDFQGAADKVDELNAKLASLVAGFGPALSPEQRQAAIDAFRERHAEEYRAFEDAGARLAPLLEGASEALSAQGLPDNEHTEALREQATLALQELPRIGETEPGQQQITRALEAQADGEQTFLDHVPDIAQTTNDAAKFLSSVSNVVVKSVGQRVLSLAAEGRPQDAYRLFTGLEANARLFGTDPESMQKITSAFYDLAAGRPNAVQSLDNELRRLDGGTPGVTPNSGASQALKGLGLVVSVAGNADAWRNFSDAELSEQIRTIGDTLGVGADGGTLALEVLGKAERLGSVSRLLGRASGVAGGVTAVIDGISAVQAFRDGEYAQGLVSSSSAVGGAILATAAFSAAAGAQVVPVAGQIAGAVLVVGGLVGQFALGKRDEHRDEADVKAFLQAAGIPEDVAGKLDDLTSDRRNMGPFIAQVAPHLDMTPAEFLQHLTTLDGDQLDQVIQMSHRLEQNDQQVFQATGEDDAEIAGQGDRAYWFRPESLEGAAQWMRELGLVPATVPHRAR